MIILVTGSREASQRLIEKAKHFVAHHSTDEFIVGDAPGIDASIIETCDLNNIKVTVYGAYGKLRNRTTQGNNIALNVSYPERDRVMASKNIDLCVAFWNGYSRGTMITVNAARARGVPTTIFNSQKPNW